MSHRFRGTSTLSKRIESKSICAKMRTAACSTSPILVARADDECIYEQRIYVLAQAYVFWPARACPRWSGTRSSVQQKMMRHADIRTTMHVYGDVVPAEESLAAEAISKMAFMQN